MRTEQVRYNLTFCAAAWCADKLKESENGFYIDEAGLIEREIPIITDPDFWEIRGEDGQYGGVHLYTAKCRLQPTSDVVELEVVHLVPDGLMFVQSGRIHTCEEMDGSGDKKVMKFTVAKGIVETRDDALKLKMASREAIVEWYMSKYNPELDHDVGTEERDWEQLTHHRSSVMHKTMKSTWLRMKSRGEETFLDTETEPGVVEVTTEEDGSINIRWAVIPVGPWAMSWATEPDKMGTWA